MLHTQAEGSARDLYELRVPWQLPVRERSVRQNKGHLRHISDGPRYVYLPTRNKNTARKTAVQHLMGTFFDDSIEATVAALLDVKSNELTSESLDQLQELINKARQEGR